MKKILFITGNKGKLKEAQQKLSEYDVEVKQKDAGYPEIQADTLEEVAEFGVNHLKDKIKDSFILEDAGIFIESLNGFPGVYSKYVFYTIGCKGILKLLEEKKNRKAVFKSVYAYYSDGEKKIFIGECEGKISRKMVGSKGFGYDPIFIPKGSDKTFAEMDTDEKNKYSHRGKSLKKLGYFFKKE